MTQNELKQAVAAAAVDYVIGRIASGDVVGVGTGSTANCFIDALAAGLKAAGLRIRGAVASSEVTAQRLAGHGIKIFDLNEITTMPVYVDGADEIDPGLHMLKGGGGALTREKIVAAVAMQFVCIVDSSKQVKTMGKFPLPVEVIPMARAYVARQLEALGARVELRANFITDNGNLILDAHDLKILDPLGLESKINQIAGVVSNGLFAARKADILLVGSTSGVQQISA